MNRAIKYRLYPNAEQQDYFAKTFACCRKIWNLMLSAREEAYAAGDSKAKVTPAMFKAEYPYLKEADSLALANVQLDLNKAYRRFFKTEADKPKFKSKKFSRKSYTTNNQKGTVSINLESGTICLPKIGSVKAVLHRLPRQDWMLKSATVSQDSDGKYYCSVLFAYEDNIVPIAAIKDKALGLDYKTASLYIDSTGHSAGTPKHYKDASTQLARAQRKLARKKKYSANWQKQNRKVNKLHKHIANQRKDFLHKESLTIAKSWDLVCIEDLSITEQIAGRKYKVFRKSTLDNGWYSFTQMLTYKLEDRGKQLVKVDKHFPSSKMCSCCGTVNDAIADDRIRKWACPSCGTHHDRDINAAINIRNEGWRIYTSA